MQNMDGNETEVAEFTIYHFRKKQKIKVFKRIIS